MKRTCYSIGPYGKDNYLELLGPSTFLMRDKYIFVYQDVRGKYMSEGEFVNMRPHIAKKKDRQFDESTDTYDTIEWLLENVVNHNGKDKADDPSIGFCHVSKLAIEATRSRPGAKRGAAR